MQENSIRVGDTTLVFTSYDNGRGETRYRVNVYVGGGVGADYHQQERGDLTPVEMARMVAVVTYAQAISEELGYDGRLL